MHVHPTKQKTQNTVTNQMKRMTSTGSKKRPLDRLLFLKTLEYQLIFLYGLYEPFSSDDDIRALVVEFFSNNLYFTKSNNAQKVILIYNSKT